MLSAALLLSLALGGSQSGGHVGLRNQGNTCYMNSLIQVLYHLPSFRRAVYALPTRADAPPGTSVPLELQRVFYELERASEADLPSVGTELLTRSLGMGPRDVNEQQDAQEFARTLCDALSGGEGDGEVGAVFEGRLLNYIRCTRVKHTSEREQRFSDLQMQVAGCGSLADSLREQFCAEETLDEYNTRTAEHGTQPARRGARAFTFPTTLRLRRYLARGAAAGAPPPAYELHSVVSHVGGADSGHYVAYVRPLGGSQWYEFDDTRVSAVDESAAVTRQFGGDYSRAGGGWRWLGARPNAYMLTYVRKAEARELRADGLAEAHLPPDVRTAFDAHLGESGRRAGRADSDAAAALGDLSKLF